MTLRINPEAIFFDLDGTLADSLGVMKLVYQQFLINNGKVPSDTEFDSLNGPPLRMVAALLKQKHDIEAELGILLSEYQFLVDKVYESVCPNPGAEELLAGARRRNFKIAIVTSNSHLRTERWLEQTGLKRFIDYIVGAEDVEAGKPSADPYLAALKLGGLKPEQCLAVEDSAAGAQAAVAANIYTFAIDWSGRSHDWPDKVHKIRKLEEILLLI